MTFRTARVPARRRDRARAGRVLFLASGAPYQPGMSVGCRLRAGSVTRGSASKKEIWHELCLADPVVPVASEIGDADVAQDFVVDEEVAGARPRIPGQNRMRGIRH